MALINEKSLLLAFLALALALMSSIVVRLVPALPPVSHAESRHGAVVASITTQCLGGDRPTMKFYNPTTKRTGTACRMDDGKLALVITAENGDPVTAFVKEKMKSAEQLIRYMRNAGYEVVH